MSIYKKTLHFGNFFALHSKLSGKCYILGSILVILYFFYMKFPFTLRTYQYMGSHQRMISSQIYHVSYIYQHATSQDSVMKNQIDHTEVTAYAKRLASMLCNQFYRQNAHITGKQLVEFTENKQINFFAIKVIFMKWQDETANLRSPYFDYTNSDVSKALTSLMNLLSQNILIARPAFEPVLVSAIADTILLSLSPQSFYSKMLTEIGENIHIANQVKPLAKYVKTNKTFFDRLLAYLEREANPTISQARAISLVQTVEQENLPNEPTQDLFNFLSKYMPVSANNFVSRDEDPLAFDTSTIIPETKSYYQQPINPEPVKVQVPLYEPVIANHHTQMAKVAAEPAVVEKIAEKIAEEQPVEVVSFNDKFSTEMQQNLHQQFAKAETTETTQIVNSLHDTTDQDKGQSLRVLIPLNKKFAYINGLFGGSAEEFEQAVDMIDQCSDYHKAIMLIKEKYFRRFAWDLEKDEVKEFYEMVSKKF